MANEAEEEYSKFEEKVKRTVCLHNLSPTVNETVIKNALEQYGTVNTVHFIPNYTEPHCNSKCALVELKIMKQATDILDFLSTYPFMVSGMPRPVRGILAEPEMFADRPQKPGRKIQMRWLDANDPDFELTQNLKRLAEKHIAEQSFLNKKRQLEEEKLSKKQEEALKACYYKYDTVASVLSHGSSKHVGQQYGVPLADD